MNQDILELLKAKKSDLEAQAAAHERAIHHHARSSTFHSELAKEYQAQAEAVRSIAKEAGVAGPNSSHAKLADSLERSAALENQHARHHESEQGAHGKLREACQKAAEDTLNKGLVPTGGISAVVDQSKSPRLVPRAGQRDPSTMPVVDPQFSHLVKVGDDRDLAG
jgi:hypothetical protein